MKRVYNLYLLSFLSAFLLFQIELIIAKIFLPKFGGSYLVWGACLVFFQCALLMGYLYSHIVIQRFGMYRYRYLHLIVILLPLFFFPGRPLPEITAHDHIPLVIDVFLQLSQSIGFVFFVLSTISIIAQIWLAQSELPEHRNPFILYAISNIGSFLALLSYPFIFEAYFDQDTQLLIWRIAYLLFIVFYIISLRTIGFSDKTAPHCKMFDKDTLFKRFEYTESVRQKLYWVLLSAAGCILFLSVTNIITYEIAPCPLLWIIPLCLYLISFVLTFREKPLYPKWISSKFHLVIGFSVLIFFFTQARLFPISIQMIAFFVSLFSLCMFCQHELYQNRSGETKDLTVFYLFISFGGLAGSLLVSWFAPILFRSPFEFLFGLFVIGLALSLKTGSPRIEFYHARLLSYAVIWIVAWPLTFDRYHFFGIILCLFVFGFLFKEIVKSKPVLCTCLFLILILAPFVENIWSKDNKEIYRLRNYYGIYKVTHHPPFLILANGTTLHGAQYATEDKVRQNEPLAYYHRHTPIGKLLGSNHFPTNRLGIVGLGIGTLSAYGKKGEVIDFFELDPDVSFISNLFEYLRNSPAKLNLFFQDARLALRKTPTDHYDILVVDAFSGDSVPVHLLTTDAIREYKIHMKDKGIILFHISNRYLDLTPVLFSNAKTIGAFALSDWNDAQGTALLASRWVALTWDRQTKATLVSRLQWKESPAEVKITALRPWTDKYSNILAVLKLDALINSIKDFKPFYW